MSAAKITFDDAKKIREIYATGQYTYSDISKIYNIGIPMISNIINKKNWNYLREGVTFIIYWKGVKLWLVHL